MLKLEANDILQHNQLKSIFGGYGGYGEGGDAPCLGTSGNCTSDSDCPHTNCSKCVTVPVLGTSDTEKICGS